jgi:hypothetical protein
LRYFYLFKRNEFISICLKVIIPAVFGKVNFIKLFFLYDLLLHAQFGAHTLQNVKYLAFEMLFDINDTHKLNLH